jgi:hypothetical protein
MTNSSKTFAKIFVIRVFFYFRELSRMFSDSKFPPKICILCIITGVTVDTYPKGIQGPDPFTVLAAKSFSHENS